MEPAPGHRYQLKAWRDWRLLLCPLVCFLGLLAACAGPYEVQEYQTGLRCPGCPVVKVSRVIDGDTFTSPTERIRLFGVDTPESGMPCFDEAKMALRRLAGREVRVENGPRPLDPVGRRLFYVYTIDGNSIDEILVREGLARAWTKDGQHRVYEHSLHDWTSAERRRRRAFQIPMIAIGTGTPNVVR